MTAKPSEQGQYRRKRGFQRADGLLAKKIAKASEGRGFAVSRLLTHWAEVAGEELADITRPVRISYGRGGFGATLTLLVRGVQAPFVQAELPKLKERVNAVYGYAAVSRIQLTQTAPTGFAEGQASFEHRETAYKPEEPDPAAIKRGKEVARDVTDPDLRLALSRMGAHILTKDFDDERA